MIFHVFIVFGISFILPEMAPEQPLSPPLKITLVAHTNDEMEPDQYDYLAQDNLNLKSAKTEQMLTPNIPLRPQQPGYEGSTAEQEVQTHLTRRNNSATTGQTKAQTQKDKETLPQDRATLTEMINQAYMNAEHKDRHLYLSGSAKQDKYVAYLEHWRQAVEKIGNSNYPEAAKIQQLQGDLVLDVVIRRSGALASIKILRSSGQKVLDDAAVRTAHLAAPFQPFPDSFSQDTDQLHIIRTWEFQYNRVTAKVLSP